MKKLTLLVSFLGLISVYALSPLSTESYGDKIGLFSTELGLSTRNIALGSACTAVNDDYTAMYFNPAGITASRAVDGGLMYSIQSRDSYLFAGGLTFPFSPKYSFGFSVIGIGSSGLIEYDGFGLATGKNYNFLHLVASLGTAYQFVDSDKFGDLSAGINLKFVNYRLADNPSFSIGIDVGLSWAFPKIQSKFGLSFQNILPPEIKVDDEFSYPINLRFGVANKSISDKLMLSLDGALIGLNENVSFFGGLGAEFSPTKYVSVQSGINNKGVNVGTSLHLYGYNIGYSLSWEIFTGADINNSINHYISFQKEFGMTAENMDRSLLTREGYVAYKELEVEYKLFLQKEDFKKAFGILKRMIANREKYEGNVSEKLLKSKNELSMKLKAEDQLKNAESAFANGEYAEARKLIDEVFTLNPDYQKGKELREKIINKMEVLANIGLIKNLFDEKKYYEASFKVEYCLKLEKDNQEVIKWNEKLKPFINEKKSDAMYREAIAFQKVAEYEKALEKIEVALDLYPNNYQADQLKVEIINDKIRKMYDQAYVKFKQKMYNDTIKGISQIVEIENKGDQYKTLIKDANNLKMISEGKIALNKAKEAIDDEDYKSAEIEIKKALAIFPDDVETKELYERLKQIKFMLGE